MVKFGSTGMEGDQSNRADPPFALTNTEIKNGLREKVFVKARPTSYHVVGDENGNEIIIDDDSSDRLSAMALPDVHDINASESIAEIAQLLRQKKVFPVQQAQQGQRKLTVQLKRVPGREPEILFGLEQIELPESEVEQQAIFDAMTAQLVAQHQHFINAILPKLPRTLTTGATTRTDEMTGEKVEAELQEYTVDRIVRSKRPSGKIEHKLVSSSGKFSQYGIVIFPEKIKEWGLDDFAIHDGKDFATMPDGITMHVDERGKYPVLVKVTGTQKRPF